VLSRQEASEYLGVAGRMLSDTGDQIRCRCRLAQSTLFLAC
jgi:hypothetical protein